MSSPYSPYGVKWQYLNHRAKWARPRMEDHWEISARNDMDYLIQLQAIYIPRLYFQSLGYYVHISPQEKKMHGRTTSHTIPRELY